MGVNNQQLWQEGVTAVTLTPSVDLGTRRTVDGNEYLYCYNGATVADKALIVRPLTANDTGYTFTVTTVADSLQPVMGVVSEQTCVAAGYAWVQTKGKAKGVLGGTVTYSVAGPLVCPPVIQGVDGVIDCPTGGTGTTGEIIGYLTTAVSDNTGLSVSVYINTGY